MPADNKKNISGRLDRIALSLSGGGVRAIGFHLGALSMLRRLGLLRKTQIISTVSGGSMPGIGYALSQQFGRSFQDYYDDFYDFLPQLNIIEELLRRLVTRKPSSPSGRNDMITAMANIYDRFYFGKYFGDYVNDEVLTFGALMRQTGRGHLEEMIFNATEFKTGTAFRFQVSKYRCLIGNGKFSICRKHAAQIRIADIMAASSCIPVGMEPLFFPDDFHWPDDGSWSKRNPLPSRPTCKEINSALVKNTDTSRSSLALMDGGVYDDQGISSTLLALNRRKTKIKANDSTECGFSLSGRGDPSAYKDWAKWMSGSGSGDTGCNHVEIGSGDLDLLVICDTPVKKASLYPRVQLSPSGQPESPAADEKLISARPSWFERRNIRQLKHMAWGFLTLLVLSAGLGMVQVWNQYWTRQKTIGPSELLDFFTNHLVLVFGMAIPLLLVILVAFMLLMYQRTKRKTMKAAQSRISKWKRKPGFYIEKLRVGDLLKMGMLRAGSVSALTSSVFMNRIRGLGYSTAYSRADLQNRILANEIFTLQENHGSENDFHSMLKEQGAWPPPSRMDRVTDRAATMATKLWIDQKEGDPYNDLDYLVAAGQATTCYNLLEYMWDHCRQDDEWLDSETGELFEMAMAEWKKLIDDPLCLLKDRMRKSRLPEQIARVEDLDAASGSVRI